MSRSSVLDRAGTAKIAYQPALDGLRAVAVTMVLLFHGKVGWMGGGYFGVSIFFTLSGFLITSLLVREYDANDRIDPKAFYARRVRRLLPASLVCLSGVTLLGAADVWTGVDNLRRDVLGALFQVANWVQLFAGESYTDLQSKNSGLASPLDHYWSLAIEEQFYWIWPLVFWGLARMARRRGWSLLPLMGGLTVFFAVTAPVIAALWGRDAAYWSTPARMAEILIGATLAVAVSAGRLRPRRWMAPVGAATVIGLAVVLPAAGGPAYHGAFALLAVPTAVLLLGVQRPGLVTSALSTWPLVALGRVSYGVYLYHFPILVLMTPARVGQSGTPLLVLQLGATIAVAVLSSRLIERPIRFGRLSGARTAIWSGAATAGVLGLAFAIPARGAAVYYAPNPELAAAAGIQPIGDLTPLVVGATTPPLQTSAFATATPLPSPLPVSPPAASPAATSPPATSPPATSPAAASPPNASTPTAPAVTNPAPSRPARILVVGDSTALATGAGLVAWAAAHPELAQVSLAVSPGCGFVRGGVVPSDEGVPFQSDCDQLLDHTLPKDLVDLQPDVVMMMVTSRDIVQRRWNDEEGLIDPSDPRFVARIRVDYQVITDLILSTTTARIVWIRAPKVDPYWLGKPHPFIDPGLLQIRESVLVETVGSNAARSQLLDLRSWMEADGIAGDIAARPDGWHFTPEAALLVAEEWLGPQLLVAASDNAVLQTAVTSTTSATTTGGAG